ncbi:MAG: bifunctional phosphoribosylaminoimidazolecarboxamide formyltransferase/IMP cyclohydrolase [Endomicrobium sp.]|jgi:phosphoribosylaminoimidazolecarboxamide formyltransferase/IMP cyclohydrolase|nr:bifunctional phosphoribosylaminoimidazolecarboxamide formyltransferase/IMP cyclohydrolase [Endomicrobium sp.]
MSTALFSVTDKTYVVDFAKELVALQWNIVSSSGTAKILEENFIKSCRISEITGFPEILDGRVKSLSPKIHSGILAIRNNYEHMKQLKQYNIGMIDMVVVDLYPFEKTVSDIPKPLNKKIDKSVIENIDIGGVTLLRAAAKNYKDVIVVCDNNDYNAIIRKLRDNSITEEFRLELAAKAFRCTAYYDSLIAAYLTYEKFPVQTVIPLRKISKLRYGENPHQEAVLYSNGITKQHESAVVISAKQLSGKQLSYNNYVDLESAWNLVHEFDNPACVIVKHNNPCGCAEGLNINDAYSKALSCDPISAFGGVLAFNGPIDENVACKIDKMFIECIIAPGYDKNALDILMHKKNIRILLQKTPYIKEKQSIEYRTMSCGMLVQDKDDCLSSDIKFVTKRHPTKEESKALDFAWKVAKHIKSNAIVLAKNAQTVGIGAGQMSRIDSLRIAIEKMKNIKEIFNEKSYPLVMASDAFFPFADVINESIKIGVVAVIQPGGSINDDKSIISANEKNIAMVITGMRHFKH